ncbi:uncharacterized protein FFUJ_10109 [Fusarium fujikuroi IMI 58289]|uniref:Uncharacterized protein n=1 Tax=Gibberella fujikuroi (strain CBS 195.34 / IMI 58289 / NRRL A-6831) TaxID=1279085 RepID=S0EEM8_GIBF5|nr:uncharacterized protein FFUJ_10109 [Fusarium fujikuroi IMI 58289]CCT73209.1 uncharacterized protein FFUJ_10109 [Fusarium fujikuroi IMI 58289]SCO16320.1 uncharacterized protein FFM5_11218 [Fusarium fujikuroi]
MNTIAFQAQTRSKVPQSISLSMPGSPETIIFSRKVRTPGNQTKVQKLVNELRENGIKVEIGHDEITFTTSPGSQHDWTAKHFQARMEKEGLWEDWKEGRLDS